MVGRTLLIERLLQQAFALPVAEQARVRPCGTVAGYLVVLDALRRRDERCVLDVAGAVLPQPFTPFLDEAGHAFAVMTAGLGVEALEDQVEALAVNRRLLEMFRERALEVR